MNVSLQQKNLVQDKPKQDHNQLTINQIQYKLKTNKNTNKHHQSKPTCSASMHEIRRFIHVNPDTVEVDLFLQLSQVFRPPKIRV